MTPPLYPAKTLNGRYRAGQPESVEMVWCVQCTDAAGEIYYVETLRIRGNAEKGGVSSDGQCPCCGELLEPYQCTCPRVEGQRREAVGTDLGLDRWLDDLSQAEEDARPRS